MNKINKEVRWQNGLGKDRTQKTSPIYDIYTTWASLLKTWSSLFEDRSQSFKDMSQSIKVCLGLYTHQWQAGILWTNTCHVKIYLKCIHRGPYVASIDLFSRQNAQLSDEPGIDRHKVKLIIPLSPRPRLELSQSHAQASMKLFLLYRH